ncbi:hypothetical protein C0993_009979 [Termitomyces sp. T159_Od127]|nr:hypothetical protein C0993_009979 [Termitomyces sp. T159_Od127]
MDGDTDYFTHSRGSAVTSHAPEAYNDFVEKANRTIARDHRNVPDPFHQNGGLLEVPSRPFGPHARISSVESISSIVEEKSNSPLNKAIASFTDADGGVASDFVQKLQMLNAKNSEHELSIEKYLVKSEEAFFGRVRKERLSSAASLRSSHRDSFGGTPASSLYSRPESPHSPGNSSSDHDSPQRHDAAVPDVVPMTRLQIFMSREIGGWPLYTIVIGLGQMLSATSFQITLLTGRNWQDDVQLYVLGGVFLAASAVWYTSFRLRPSVYVLSAPWIFFGLAFFLIGLPSVANAIHPAHRVISSVATWSYAVASAAAFLFFGLNFGEEASRLVSRQPHTHTVQIRILNSENLMLGIEGYGSGSEDDSDHETVSAAKPTIPTPKPAASTPKSGIALPPPKAKRTKKITIGLPSLPAENRAEDDDLTGERPAAKRPRLENGAGKSSLLSMLPAPKERAPVAPAPERVLGGGKGRGLDFGASRTHSAPLVQDEGDVEDIAIPSTVSEPQDTHVPQAADSLPFLPPSLKKGRPNVSLEDDKPRPKPQPPQKPAAPAVDFFSLGSTASSTKASQPSSSSNPTPSISSAPDVPTFEIPEPSQTDEYPGYYQLPSGAWAAHDPAYYAKFVKKWQAEYDKHVRALEKGMAKGFEDLESAEVEDVNAMAEMERAKREIKEREERKALTQGAGGAPAAPRMTINASKTSGIARSRHQLSTLLKEAYENREALEEKIAMGKRNRKEAGNKYGF